MSIDAIGTFEYWLGEEVEHLIVNTLPDNYWHLEYCNDGCEYDNVFVLNVRKEGNHLHFRDVKCVVPPCDYDIFTEDFDENDVTEANLVSLLFKHFTGLGFDFDQISYHTTECADDIQEALEKAVNAAVTKKHYTTLTFSTGLNAHT